MSNVQDEIRSRVAAFVTELSALVRHAAYDAVEITLGAGAPAPRAKAAPAAKARPAAAAAPPKATPAGRGRSPKAAPARKPGQKRDPRDLARLVERLADYIRTNPGQRIEQINRALGVPTKDLTLPIRKLLSSHRIIAVGEKRATTYAPK